MTKRTIVIRRQNCGWQTKTKRKIELSQQALPKLSGNAGFARPFLVVIASAVCVGLLYIYAINHSAVQGVAIRQAENEISKLKKENEGLRIKEAELKSLYHVEELVSEKGMMEIQDVNYIDERDTIAYRVNK